jgi:hypothetical protein
MSGFTVGELKAAKLAWPSLSAQAFRPLPTFSTGLEGPLLG